MTFCPLTSVSLEWDLLKTSELFCSKGGQINRLQASSLLKGDIYFTAHGRAAVVIQGLKDLQP